MEFDPTNGVVGNRDLIRVAVVRDPSQAVPLSGSWLGLPADFQATTIEVAVTRVDSSVPGSSLPPSPGAAAPSEREPPAEVGE